VDSLVGLT